MVETGRQIELRDGTMVDAEQRILSDDVADLYVPIYLALHRNGLAAPNFKDVTTSGHVPGTGSDGGYRSDLDGNRISWGQRAILIEIGDFPEFVAILESTRAVGNPRQFKNSEELKQATLHGIAQAATALALLRPKTA